MKDPTPQAKADLAVILKAWLDGGQADIPKLIKNADQQDMLLASMALNAFFLQRTTNPQAVFDVLLEDDPLHQAQVHVSAMGAAREWLWDQLAAGPKRLDHLKDANDEQLRLPWKAVSNAARNSGVVYIGRKGGQDNVWLLPPSEFLRRSLATGRKQRTAIRARALSQGYTTAQIADAARSLGVVKDGTYWSLPSAKSATAPQAR